MSNDDDILRRLQGIVSATQPRNTALQAIADTIRSGGKYRWVGLYDVDHTAAVVRTVAFSGPGAPEYLTFPITKGLTGAAVAQKFTVNVGDVTTDARYLTAFGSTRSEIIVPIFDAAKQKVIGTIDVESEQRDAFSKEVQAILERWAEVIAGLWS